MSGERIVPEVGIHAGVPFDEYRSWDCANHSTLWLMRQKSPMHARYEQMHPSEPTEALRIGQALHSLVLEPETFAAKYAIAPKCDRRTKDGKAAYEAFLAEAGDRVTLSEIDHQTIQAVAQAMESQIIHRLVRTGRAEVAIVWVDRDTGILCKAKLDYVHEQFDQIIVDLKSTTDASPGHFQRDMYYYGYFEQAAFYSDGWETLSGLTPSFTFLAVEKELPFAAAAYEVQADTIEAGRLSYKRTLRTYGECLKSGVWPGYADKIVPMDIPAWACRTEGVNDFQVYAA